MFSLKGDTWELGKQTSETQRRSPSVLVVVVATVVVEVAERSRAVSQLLDGDQPRKVQSEAELPVDSSRTTSSLSTSSL